MGDTIPIEKMNSIFRVNNIDVEVSILYRDVIITLMDKIFKTYLGDELTNKIEQKKHFNWSWEATKKDFSREGFSFTNDTELKDYFYGFIEDVYYESPEKNETIEFNLKKLWYYLFNPVKEKTQSDIDVFIEIYDMFTHTIFG